MTTELGIIIENNRPVVSSRDVARVFEEEHKHVMEAIREFECDEEFGRSNFRPIDYSDAKDESHLLLYIWLYSPLLP